MPIVSIVISSHRPDLIGGLLEALAARDCRTPFETIVVADYPVEAPAARYPQASWVHHPDRSIAAKRNRGAALARGRILGFIDDDCRPLDGWIDAAVSFLESTPDCAAVEGQTTIAPGGEAGGALREFRRLERPGFRTNNIFYTRQAFERAGAFDERFSVQREDVDLAFTVIEGGGSIGFCNEVRVEHRFRPGEKWDLLKNCVNRRFDPLLYKKHKRLYREHIRSPFTPAIGLVLLTHALLAAAWAVKIAVPEAALIDAAAVSLCVIRRSGFAAGEFAREWLSFALAPPVLLGALVLGSVRHRQFLLF